jgi:hypothetical protein
LKYFGIKVVFAKGTKMKVGINFSIAGRTYQLKFFIGKYFCIYKTVRAVPAYLKIIFYFLFAIKKIFHPF